EGGADLYGLKAGQSISDPYFSSVVSGAPAGAIAAIYNQNIGSNNDNYLDQNSLFFLNLSGTTLTNPEWGLTIDSDGSFTAPLLTRGFAENPLFGGDGADTLTSLAPGAVYATIIPNFTGGFKINASASGVGVTNQVIPNNGDGTIIYLVGLPGDFDIDFNVDGADFLAWQRGFGTVYDAGDLADWQTNLGAADAVATGSAVPEGSTLLLAGLGLTLLLACRGRLEYRRSC
ncbi:MAG: hypothetical protein GXP24_03450, partial [Planctomycetes bacterium]|nr:hypothetical protein [Planctomycetota bacterium]